MDDAKGIFRSHRTALLRAARTQLGERGRGVVIAVHAGGLLQLVLYRVPDDAEAYLRPDSEAASAIRDVVRTYDPGHETVVFVADSLTDTFSCWVLSDTTDPSERLVWHA